ARPKRVVLRPSFLSSPRKRAFRDNKLVVALDSRLRGNEGLSKTASTGGTNMPTNTTPAVNPNVTRSRLVLEIAEQMTSGTAENPKLRIMMRGALDHTLHHMFDDVAAAAGFSREDIQRWGGEVLKKGSVPWPHTPTFKALINGEVDALFDEAAHSWVPQALDA